MPRRLGNIDTNFKKKFVKSLIENNNNKTEAYLKAQGGDMTRHSASQLGPRLFHDPEVQEIYKNQGVDIGYLAKRNRELMDSKNEGVAASLVRQFNKVVLSPQSQVTKKLNVNLFGDLTDAQVERISKGRKIEGEDEGTSESSP